MIGTKVTESVADLDLYPQSATTKNTKKIRKTKRTNETKRKQMLTQPKSWSSFKRGGWRNIERLKNKELTTQILPLKLEVYTRSILLKIKSKIMSSNKISF